MTHETHQPTTGQPGAAEPGHVEPGTAEPSTHDRSGVEHLSDAELLALSDEQAILPEEVKGIKAALVRYRVMAYVVGVLLVVLVCVGLPLKYIWNNGAVVTWTGVPHGWLYMILIITAFDLGRRVHWSWGRLALIALAGTVPFLSFVAEHFATKNVHERLAEHVITGEEATVSH